MQIIIDIPKVMFINAKSDLLFGANILVNAIKNGTPLPKGHGNIYDENDIKKSISNPYQCQTVLYGLELVKPIIKADTESEVQK